MRTYSKRSLANLQGIHPDLRRVIDRALQDSPLDFVVIEGLRSVERQRQLVAQGASKTMNSRHIIGHAVDLLPLGPDGKAAFDWPLYHKLGPAVEAAAKTEGVAIVWGGRWTKFKDGPHFELDRKVYPDGKWKPGVAAPVARTPLEAGDYPKPLTPVNADKPKQTIAPPVTSNQTGGLLSSAPQTRTVQAPEAVSAPVAPGKPSGRVWAALRAIWLAWKAWRGKA